ncbi:hypothetical protein N2152v2_002331 [Parachlorella kessleri]
MAPFGLPSGLYTTPTLSMSALAAVSRQEQQQPAVYSPAESTLKQKFMQALPVTAYAPAEGGIKMYSRDCELGNGSLLGGYYLACGIGGILSCGITHTMVTPLDVVKCNMQISPAKYPGIFAGFRTIVAEQGARGLFKGWVPTAFGYSAQGACKFGFYEYFKKTYADLAGPENAKKYQTLIFLAGSASAEFIADIALCPFEAVKVKVQTVPGYARGFADGLPKFVQQEGVAGLFKGVTPLWGRQIPYTMMKFAAFENVVQALYKYVVPKPRSECSKTEQLGVSFAAGYIAGVLCAIVSHPADNLVSKLNATKGVSAGEIIKEMGWVALFTRGLPLRIIMIGTLTGLQWGIYDAFKVFVGLPTTGAEVKK